ncbi:signal transduction histidine kinase [Evansella vedderi]|uniref:histidine kinase n=1 Tax=Evansella vedderi TaxID=38282 RepID=A0ABT9ZZE6_9BACI|nr:GAF domain-containing sensor histidine kinase [Evansella vedderi]MDQ0256623.1 signal transduction histidine kinase [Evansella vedderi]
MNTSKREQLAKVYMMGLSIGGWCVVAGSFFYMELPATSQILLYLMLVAFLALTEYFPIPVWKGNSSISFPIIYAMDLVFGLPVLLMSYAVIVFLINYLHRRPIRIIFFNPAQLVVSYFLAKNLTDFLTNVTANFSQPVGHLLFELTLLVFFFYLINNIIVDIVLWIRPQPYRLTVWLQKWGSEVFSAGIAYFYVALMIFLGAQGRSHLDIFAAFFFFSPLVGFSLLSSSIARLRKERNRLKAMFAFTNDLNKTLPSQEWISSSAHHLQELLDVQAIMLLSRDGEWQQEYKEGLVLGKKIDTSHLEPLMETELIMNRRKKSGPLDTYFHPSINALVYAPLLLDEEPVGLLVVGKTRTFSFDDEDVRSISTLANQLAVAIKTKLLISEQKEKRVLEERNRIAREIHDGVAQTLAGAVMNLETAQKKFSKSPSDSLTLVEKSLSGLRNGLKEIRQSIYALRPKGSERVGLEQAIRKRIEIIRQASLNISFEVRGKIRLLPGEVEKVMFETFQESVQNTMKHAEATKVDVLLSYQSKHVLLKVKDNGRGFSLYDALLKAREEPHFGLLSMNEEAEKIDASLQIDSKPGEGTDIILTIPLEKIEGDDLDD